ncbi:MAG TPA: protein TolR [Burkholderiaceae bacterium]|nr:protein TolR [Burkholderiaceae bacterium]
MASIRRKGRSGRRAIAEINVVPYIDVMLVLLIIFMVTAPFVNPAVVDLPVVGKASQLPAAPPLEVVVKADGTMSVRSREAGQREQTVTRSQLVGEVQRRMRGNPDTPVVISADKSVRYEAVTDVMSDLQSNNVRRVGLLVKPRGS